jgi:hypothetical protein
MVLVGLYQASHFQMATLTDKLARGPFRVLYAGTATDFVATDAAMERGRFLSISSIFDTGSP